MTEVTVLVPAYRSEAFIGETIASVLAQTHRDLRLLIGVDPSAETADGTMEAIAPFLSDGRIAVHVNPRRLGWAGNVADLMACVETPLFAPLPHDDLWAPDYLQSLCHVLETRPEASAAYSNQLCFGAGRVAQRSLTLPDGEDALAGAIRFLTQFPLGSLWRGVTRSSTLARTGGFPTDEHRGFGSEWEYCLALLACGPVAHVRRALFFKRLHPGTGSEASSERYQASPERLREAWDEHDRRMRRWLGVILETAVPGDPRIPLARAAADYHVLSRLQSLFGQRFSDTDLQRAEAALAACAASSHPLAGPLASNIHLQLRGHWAKVGDKAQAGRHLADARDAWPSSSAVALVDAQVLLWNGQPLGALERADAALQAAPDGRTDPALALIDRIRKQLGWP